MKDYIKLERMAQRGFRYFEQPDADFDKFSYFRKEVLEPRSEGLIETITATETTEECGRIMKIVSRFEGIVTEYR